MDNQADNLSKAIRPAQAAKHDLNLVLRSCFVLSRKDQRRQVVRRWKAPDNEGVTKEFEIVVKSSERLPWFRDNEVLMMYITKAQRENSPEVEFSEYEVLKWLGFKDGGSAYQGLRASNDRLVAVTLRGTFWVKNEDKSQWVEFTKWGHLVDTVELAEAWEEQTGAKKMAGLRVRLSNLIWNDIQSGNLLTFNWDEYKTLIGDSVRAIYLYVNSIRQVRWEVDIFQLAETHLGMGHYQHASRVWEKLEPMLQAAQEQGVIRHYERVKRGKYVRVLFEKQIQQLSLLETLPGETNCPAAADNPLVEELVRRGVDRHKAQTMAAHPPGDWQDRLRYFDQKIRTKPPRDPAAWLVWLITSPDFQYPQNFKKAKRDAEANEPAEPAVTLPQQLVEEEQDQKQALHQQQALLAALETQYGTTDTLRKQWSLLVHEIQSRLSRDLILRELIKQSYLLAVSTDGEVVIAVPDQMVRDQLAAQLGMLVTRLLETPRYIGRPVSLKFVTLDGSDSHQTPATAFV